MTLTTNIENNYKRANKKLNKKEEEEKKKIVEQAHEAFKPRL